VRRLLSWNKPVDCVKLVSIEVIRARARDPRVLNGARYGQMVALVSANRR
jgi:hypothetical protein